MALKVFLEQKRWNDAKEILKCSELLFEYIHPQYFELLFTKLYLLRRELDVIYAGDEPEAASVMQVLLKQLEELSLKPPYLPDVRLPSNTGIFEIPKDISGDGSRCGAVRKRVSAISFIIGVLPEPIGKSGGRHSALPQRSCPVMSRGL